ncbi:MAG: zinc ribbon domain-containing protein [Sulfuricella sp.]
MPIYDYRCNDCNKTFELLNQVIQCPGLPSVRQPATGKTAIEPGGTRLDG